ncbi:MAG: peptidoglycan editing factor PgeF [Chloroflexi bacterium]|nr:peptidoglycan editing factor PgeF [Chloroflexota bacterium]
MTATILPVERGVYRIAALDPYQELVHAISTRRSPEGAYWNLSARRGSPEHPPDQSDALANRRSLAERLGISLDKMVGCQQVHQTVVARVGPADEGRGMSVASPSIQGADAMITDARGLYLLALSADCPPIFFYDPLRQAIGLAHSGWRGTVGRIAANVVGEMSRCFGTVPSDLVVAVGPGIGPCCYAVGQNVVDAVEANFYGAWEGPTPLLTAVQGSVYFNLWEAIRLALIDAGVTSERISVERVCTACNSDMFFSHRAEEGRCGLFGAVLGMREQPLAPGS